VLDPRTAQAVERMTSFAQRTGVTAEGGPRRYLWTDAFAVCNLLGLARTLGEQHYHEHALRLVDQVHRSRSRRGAAELGGGGRLPGTIRSKRTRPPPAATPGPVAP